MAGGNLPEVDPLNLQRLQAVPPDAARRGAGFVETEYAIEFDDALAARIVVSGRRVVN